MVEPDVRPVRIGRAGGSDAQVGRTRDRSWSATEDARALVGADVAEVLAWAADVAVDTPLPGDGRTLDRWELLASVGAQDLTVARTVEPHLDAVAILAEAGQSTPPSSTWGVWAAEGPGARLEASGDDDAGWVLNGRKPWCSLAGTVSHALVTAWVGAGGRRLFAVSAAADGFVTEPGTWVPAGLPRVRTTPVAMTGVPARPVGSAGWYLDRDGFWWGGIGVAAVWYGGAVGLARRLAAQLRSREPDQVGLMHLGEVDAALAAARAVLARSAAAIDAGEATGPDAVVLGARVRQVVAGAAETVMRHIGHALGPGPLSQEPEHVARVADLALYVRQHHGERDAAGLGQILHERGATPW